MLLLLCCCVTSGGAASGRDGADAGGHIAQLALGEKTFRGLFYCCIYDNIVRLLPAAEPCTT